MYVMLQPLYLIPLRKGDIRCQWVKEVTMVYSVIRGYKPLVL